MEVYNIVMSDNFLLYYRVRVWICTVTTQILPR